MNNVILILSEKELNLIGILSGYVGGNPKTSLRKVFSGCDCGLSGCDCGFYSKIRKYISINEDDINVVGEIRFI